MCGIWGLLSTEKQNYEEQTTKFNLFSTIKNRGPDRTIFINNNNYMMGFHRLSIMDLSSKGDQPFTHSSFIASEKGDIILRTTYMYCNGEIYNYLELRSKTNRSGYTYSSNSDCEVIIALFLELGMEKTIKQLDGEFAFAIFDTFENKTNGKTTTNLYLGRDRFGIRPLFYTFEEEHTFMFSSEMKGLNKEKEIQVFQPRTWMQVSSCDDKIQIKSTEYYNLENSLYIVFKPNVEDVFQKIRDTFSKAVISRMMSEKEVGCLLSGGLDSSLVASIASAYLKTQGKVLRTFSIGMKGSPDSYYASKVANHINSIHTNIEIPVDTWINSIEKVVEVSETYDITTIRATTGQYLISKWISENTDIKVLLIGDGSDELTGGYLYFHNCPNIEDLHAENIRLLENIHYFDVLRSDRGISSNGLEARVPFLDKNFVETYLSIDPCLRMPTVEPSKSNRKIEKWLLRKAFDTTGLLPSDVLWRKKEAFSDGVSSIEKSWFKIIQENVEGMYTDEQFNTSLTTFPFPEKLTKEGLWYYEIFTKLFGNQSQVCPYYWLPKWVGDTKDPSARTLQLYDE
jgi:asparagine synthase (glutamine-hydrolysing)